MPDDNGRLFRGRIQTPLVVLPLLALLFVFLSSITHQQAASVRADHGFVGNLKNLVVASQTESIRAPGDDNGNDAAADGDSELPDWWRNHPLVLAGGLCRTICITARVGYPSSAIRFLIPLLRAPPLA